MDKISGQPTQRRYATFLDQHGRRWGGTIEVRSGHFVDEPHPHFSAPVVPPGDFVHPHPQNPMGVVIRYDLWAASVKNAKETWEKRLREWAIKLGLSGKIADLIENPPPELRGLVGEKPEMTSLEVIQSAAAGNHWVITGDGPMPKAAAAFFPKDGDTDIVQRRRKIAAMTLPDTDPFAEEGEEGAATASSGKDVVPPGLYALEMPAPGRWKMPDGELFGPSKTREDALAELAEKFPRHHEAMLASA